MSTLGSLFYIHLEAQSASSFADVLAGKRFSSSNFAPGASACMLLPESPMPLMPDVAKGTTVFPEKSYCSIKVSMIEGSLYHYTGKPTIILSHIIYLRSNRRPPSWVLAIAKKCAVIISRLSSEFMGFRN